MTKVPFVGYTGMRTATGAAVRVFKGGKSSPLNPRFDLREHSPTGFEWGYAGSGPSQLALAILADYFGNDDLAFQHYHTFKFGYIASITTDQWSLSMDKLQFILDGMNIPLVTHDVRNAKRLPPPPTAH